MSLRRNRYAHKTEMKKLWLIYFSPGVLEQPKETIFPFYNPSNELTLSPKNSKP